MQGRDVTGRAKIELERLRGLMFASHDLQADLGEIENADVFNVALAVAANARGLQLTPDDLTPGLGPDPLGLHVYATAPCLTDLTPMRNWLPVNVHPMDGEITIEWAYFGRRGLTEPFYQDTVRAVLSRPFNRLFCFRTPLDVLPGWAAEVGGVPPSGFIFHMSRCGSTLAAQMLAAASANIVVSEAAPIDAMVQLGRLAANMPTARRCKLLQAMVGVFGQTRAGETHYVVKLDSWHTLALPLFREAFPDTPWIFLYRDPVEVMVSQMRQRGMQTVPAIVPPELYGLSNAEGGSAEDYCARVLAAVCGAVPQAFEGGGGLLVNYDELLDVICTRIPQHFGIPCLDEDRRRMAAVAHHDAKAPTLEFTPDADDKQNASTDAINAACFAHLVDVYADLERLRLGLEAMDKLPNIGGALPNIQNPSGHPHGPPLL